MDDSQSLPLLHIGDLELQAYRSIYIYACLNYIFEMIHSKIAIDHKTNIKYNTNTTIKPVEKEISDNNVTYS